MPLTLKVPSFNDGDFMDRKFTCDGDDLSPALSWSGPPSGARSFAVIMDDPDAPLGAFVHWVVYNIGPDVRVLTEYFPSTPQTKDGITQGKGGMGKVGYRGPCPPGKNPHRYVFHLYATKLDPNLPQGMNKKELLRMLEGNVIEETSFTLKYGRTKR